MRSDSSICFMKPCGFGSVAAASCASFNRAARRAGSRTCASCSVKASTLCLGLATTAFLGLECQVQGAPEREGCPQRRGISRDDEAVAVARDARNLALWQRLQVGVGVDAAPFVDVAAVDGAAGEGVHSEGE